MFNVSVYSNVQRGNELLADWTGYVSGLRYASEAFGGFASCSFTLKLDYKRLLNIVEGVTNRPTYISNRVRIRDDRGRVVYEGKIFNLNLRYGAQVHGRSMDQLYNIARLGYTLRGYNTPVWATYNDATSRGLFGNRVYRTDLDGIFTAGTNPLNRATRFVVTHRSPSKPTAQVTGGSGDEIALEVDCVGLSEELTMRFAENTRGKAVDTAQIVKDMLQPGSITSGTGAWRGSNGWSENLHTSFGGSGNIPYAAESISTANLTNITNSGITIAPVEVHNQTRWEIIKACAAYGTSNNKRVLFQVWEQDGRATVQQNGKGLAYFLEQPSIRGSATGYGGYYNNTAEGFVFDSRGERLPLHAVKAGQWITTVNMPSKTYMGVTSVFDDPRMFWIERAEYDADAHTLTLSSDNDASTERYLANLMSVKKELRLTE
jgi:hypothetical protein